MTEITKPIEGEENDEEQKNQRAAGAPEGATGAEPTSAEVESLYKDLGIKAPVPTGATKGRPKASDVRTKDAPKSGTGDSDSERKKEENADDKGKPKDASASDKDGGTGDKADSKSKENGSKDDGVQDKSGDADKGVRDAKPGDEKDSERGREKDSEQRAAGDESAEHEQKREAEGKPTDEEVVKRPGKSNPAVEQRFQKLTEEKRQAEQRAEELEKKLQERERETEQAKIAQEDPEYTVEDFMKVKDREGNIIDLDKDQAELQWRRWKDGYDDRAAERQAKANQEAKAQEESEESTRQLMKQSVEAYDSLAQLMDEYPELVSTSDKFDADFAAKAMPVIQEAIQYLEGTEPGNAEEKTPVIIGLKINPKTILEALKGINTQKRSLPLNGVNDNVEKGSNVSVPHSRSSDPTVNQANELMKELKINKRF